MTKPIGMWTLAAALGCVALVSSGCSSKCAQLKKEYEATTVSVSPFVAKPASGDDLPVHLAVTLRDELLNDVVDRAVRSGLAKALTFADEVSLATGQTIGLTTEGEVADVGLFPDKACDECLRVDGRLGGSVTLKLPVLGEQKVPLTGAFSVVAPVAFGRTDDGRAAVKLDLARAAELGRSQVDPEVTQLPPTWWKLIESPLSNLMVEAITKDLAPVTLFTFEGPDLGIEGLELVPAKLVSDAKRGVVFAGFHTNLNVPEGSELEVMTELGKNHDIAVGADIDVLNALTRAMLAAGKLSRTWTKDGEADPQGPIHIGIDGFIGGFRFTQATDAGAPYTLDFRAWNLTDGGQCWWADTRASGTLKAGDGGALSLAVDEVELVKTSMAGVFESVARWTTSRLFAESSKVVTKTLDPERLEFPGGRLEIGKTAFSTDGRNVWFKANASAAE